VTVSWIRLHSEEPHKFCCSPNVIRVKKSRMMGWAGHVALMREMRNEYEVSVGKPEETTRKT
jgi:hypothetical protein